MRCSNPAFNALMDEARRTAADKSGAELLGLAIGADDAIRRCPTMNESRDARLSRPGQFARDSAHVPGVRSTAST